MHNFARGAGTPEPPECPPGAPFPLATIRGEPCGPRPWPEPGRTHGCPRGGRGASGYAGGELLRLIAGHPDLELGPVTAGANAGAPGHRRAPAPARAGRALTFEPDRSGPAGLGRPGLPGPASRGVGGPGGGPLPAQVAVIDLSASFRLVRPGGSGRASTGASTPGAGCTGCRNCRAPGSGSPRPAGSPPRAATPPRHPGPRPPAGQRAWPSRQDIVVVSASGTSAPGRSPIRGAAGDRGDGRGVGVPGGRGAPAHPGDRAGPGRGGRGRGEPTARMPPGRRSPSPRCWPPCPAASWPPAPPGWPTGAAAAPTPCRRASWPCVRG